MRKTFAIPRWWNVHLRSTYKPKTVISLALAATWSRLKNSSFADKHAIVHTKSQNNSQQSEISTGLSQQKMEKYIDHLSLQVQQYKSSETFDKCMLQEEKGVTKERSILTKKIKTFNIREFRPI